MSGVTRPTWDDARWPTATEWCVWFLQNDVSAQLLIAQRTVEELQRAEACFLQYHAGRITGLRGLLADVEALADLYDENGRARTPKPPWAHIATEVRNAARGGR